jgi:hypothetical protein
MQRDLQSLVWVSVHEMGQHASVFGNVFGRERQELQVAARRWEVARRRRERTPCDAERARVLETPCFLHEKRMSHRQVDCERVGHALDSLGIVVLEEGKSHRARFID